MKRMLAFTLLLCSLTAMAQSETKTIDPKLVGSWKGTEKDKQLEGVEKHWVQHRFADGTYLILFTVIHYTIDEVESFAEKGTWWIENGKFYEVHSQGETPEVYSYKFIDDDHVKLKIIEGGENFDNPNYEFIDVRIKEDSL